MLLNEIQHRVKNNLQMITALIRLETRNAPRGLATASFERLAGRIESLQLLYKALTDHGLSHEVDLGVYFKPDCIRGHELSCCRGNSPRSQG